jgi:3-hydroxybutyrate dehydrogenase
MDPRFRVALVTGGGRGIGRAIAFRLARARCAVAVAARTRSEIEEVAQQIAREGGSARAVPCDATRREEVEKTAAAVAEALGPIDVLVNNAGTAESAPLARTDEPMWDRILAANLKSTYLFTRAVLPGMIQRGRGRVVSVASVAGKVGGAYISAYAAAKHGVVGFTRSVALEAAPHGVTVNAVCPGYVDTSLTERSIRNIVERTGRSPEEARAALVSKSPQNRFVEPEEVAALVLFLCSEEAAGINGQAINLDGGGIVA